MVTFSTSLPYYGLEHERLSAQDPDDNAHVAYDGRYAYAAQIPNKTERTILQSITMVVLTILSFGLYHMYRNHQFNEAIDKQDIDLAARAIKWGTTNYVESEKLQQLIADGKMFSVSFLFAQTAGTESGKAFEIAQKAVRSDLEGEKFLQVFDLYRLHHPAKSMGEGSEKRLRDHFIKNLEQPEALAIETHHDGVQPDLLSSVRKQLDTHPEGRTFWNNYYWAARDPFICFQFLVDQMYSLKVGTNAIEGFKISAEEILTKYPCVLDEVFEPLQHPTHPKFCQFGGTPLRAAVEKVIVLNKNDASVKYDIVQFLLEKGAKPGFRYMCKTPFDLAMESEDAELCNTNLQK